MSKTTIETKRYILDLIRENYPRFTYEISNMNGKQFADIYVQLLKFVMPLQRPQSQTIETQNEVDNLF